MLYLLVSCLLHVLKMVNYWIMASDETPTNIGIHKIHRKGVAREGLIVKYSISSSHRELCTHRLFHLIQFHDFLKWSCLAVPAQDFQSYSNTCNHKHYIPDKFISCFAHSIQNKRTCKYLFHKDKHNNIVETLYETTSTTTAYSTTAVFLRQTII